MKRYSISSENLFQMSKPQLIQAAREVGILDCKYKSRSEILYEVFNKMNLNLTEIETVEAVKSRYSYIYI